MITSQFSQSTLHHATILEKNDCLYYVRVDNKVITAKRAFGCLVEPDNGDTILLSVQGTDVFILSVLIRTGSSDSVLSSTGNLQIQLPNGMLDINSKAIAINSSDTFTITSPTLSIDTIEAEMKFAGVSLIGKSIQCFIDKLKIVGDCAESIFKKIFQYAEHSHRQIDNTESIRCANLNYNVENMLQMRGNITHISSPQDVHIKGERVHLG